MDYGYLSRCHSRRETRQAQSTFGPVECTVETTLAVRPVGTSVIWAYRISLRKRWQLKSPLFHWWTVTV